MRWSRQATGLNHYMRIGVDLGGTKIEALALGPDGRELLRRRVATPRGDYAGTIAAIVDLVRGVERELGMHASVGVGIPGAVSPSSGLVKNANSVWLIGKSLGDDLGAALGRTVRLANDANCFALSEATDGAAQGASVVFGVIIGTGTGGGIVVNGQVVTGINAVAGEWGHNPLPWPESGEWPGPSCYCGRWGCIETFLSGPGLERTYCETTGHPAPAPVIVVRADQGEPAACAVLDRYEHQMARALASLINVLDPDVIVVGGGMSNIERLYDNVPRYWSQFIFTDRVRTKFVRARYGDSSGVRGAAWLWPATGDGT